MDYNLNFSLINFVPNLPLSCGICTSTWCDSIHAGTMVNLNANFTYYSISNPDSVHFISTTNPVNTLYDWSFCDGTSSADQYPWHLFQNAGVYMVCLNVSNAGSSNSWCDSAVTIQVTTVPFIVHSGATISIYPNPSHDFLTVSILNISNAIDFRIYDVTGRLIYTKENLRDGSFTLATKDFVRGLYYFTVVNENEVISKGKLIVTD